MAAVPSVLNKLEKLRESIAEKLVSAEGASPSMTSQIENKGGFGTAREQKRTKFVPYQPEKEQYYDHFFSINFEGDEKRKINPFAMIDSIAECTGMKPK